MPNNVTQQAIYIQSGDPATENINPLPVLGQSVGDPYPGTMGMRVTIKEPGPMGVPGAVNYRDKTWQRILTDSAMTVSPFKGAVAWWADKTKYMVTTDPTKLGQGNVARVFQGAITKGYIGFIQCQGPGTVKLVDAPTSTPTATSANIIIPSSTAGKADSLAAGSAGTYPSLGTAAGAMSAGDNTVIVNLDVPHTP